MSAIHPGFEVTWLGHSGFWVKTPGGKVIGLDPWLDNPKCPPGAGDLEKLDLLLISHGHGDHMGSAAALSAKYGCPIVGIYELATYLGGQGSNVIGMNKGGTLKWNDLEITMVNAHHSSADVDSGPIMYLGEPAGYVVKCEDGFTFYFAGDTCVFGDMRIIADIYEPELAFLPIGDLYTMGPREAATAVRLLSVNKVIPMHWGTFDALTGTPEALRQLSTNVPDLIVYDLTPGVPL